MTTYSLIISLLVSIIFFATLAYVNARTGELEYFSLENSARMNEELLLKEIEISPLNITLE